MSSTAGPGGADACAGGLGVEGADGRGACRDGEPQPPPQLLPQLLPQNCACAGAAARHSVSATVGETRHTAMVAKIMQTKRTASLMQVPCKPQAGLMQASCKPHASLVDLDDHRASATR